MAKANENEGKPNEEGKKPDQKKPEKKEGLWKDPAGKIGSILTAVWLVLLCVVLVLGLVGLWPQEVKDDSGDSSSAKFLFWPLTVSDEVRLLLIVALAGALGSLVHALRSLYWYVGNRELVRSWVMKYMLLPFVGAAVALIFYFVIRGGFFSQEVTMKEADPFGFAALGGLVGMFSEAAVLKLKEIAETIFKTPPPGENPKPQEEKKPTEKAKPKPQ